MAVLPEILQTVQRKEVMPTKLKLRTMPRAEVIRLAYCNSKRLPAFVVDGGVVKRWVGIGWIAEDRKPQKGDVELV